MAVAFPICLRAFTPAPREFMHLFKPFSLLFFVNSREICIKLKFYAFVKNMSVTRQFNVL